MQNTGQPDQTAGRPLRALIVEDSENDAALLVRALRSAGYTLAFERVQTASAMRAALTNGNWDIVFSDHDVPELSSQGALKVLQETGMDLPFIIVSGSISDETAVNAVRAGAHDCVMKDNLGRLLPAIERELKEVAIRRQHKQAQEARRS
jgi:DNA-binding NtrC family response regulator